MLCHIRRFSVQTPIKATIIPVLHHSVASPTAEQIRSLRPTQLFLETDDARLHACISSLISGAPLSAPSRADIVATVHGGLLTRELKEVVEVGREIGSAIYCVDRPSGITQNRVAKAVLNPVVFKGFLKYAAESVSTTRESSQAPHAIGSKLSASLLSLAPTVHSALIKERAEFISAQVSSLAQENERVAVVVGAALVPEIEAILSDSMRLEKAVARLKAGELTFKGASLWPLVILLYLVVPAVIAGTFWFGSVRWVLRKLRRIFGVPDEGDVVRPKVLSNS